MIWETRDPLRANPPLQRRPPAIAKKPEDGLAEPSHPLARLHSLGGIVSSPIQHGEPLQPSRVRHLFCPEK